MGEKDISWTLSNTLEGTCLQEMGEKDEETKAIPAGLYKKCSVGKLYSSYQKRKHVQKRENDIMKMEFPNKEILAYVSRSCDLLDSMKYQKTNDVDHHRLRNSHTFPLTEEGVIGRCQRLPKIKPALAAATQPSLPGLRFGGLRHPPFNGAVNPSTRKPW